MRTTTLKRIISIIAILLIVIGYEVFGEFLLGISLAKKIIIFGIYALIVFIIMKIIDALF